MAEIFSVKFDTTRLEAALDTLAAEAKKKTRPAAQAGAQVFYDEAKMRAPVSDAPHFFYGRLAKGARSRTIYSFEPGSLKNAIYQVFSKDESNEAKSTYHIAWNHQKVPYGFMYEFGHIQTRKVYLGSDGYWYTSPEKLPTPKLVKPEPFMRPSFDAKKDEALQAASDRWVADMSEVLSS